MLLRQHASLALLLVALLAVPGTAQDEAIPEESTPPPAAGGEAGHGSMGFRLGYYDNNDSGDGNPFLDEDLSVIEPVFVFDYNISDKLAWWGEFSYDYVSSASIDRLSKFPDQSGASGDYYFGLKSGLRYKLADDLRVGGFASGSIEYDYTSVGFGGDISKDLADKNATLKWSLNGFYDQIDIIRFNGSESEGDKDRVSATTGLTYYQIIDPRTHGEVGAVFSYQTGFLETAYNAIVVEDVTLPPNPNLDNLARGTEFTEELPGSRARVALFGRVRRFYDPGFSLEWATRIYHDSWGINSLTLEPRYYQWLVADRLAMRLRYRFYIQTEARDFDDSFLMLPRHRTQDSDLGDYYAHGVGIKFDWHVNERWKWDVGVDYTVREDDINQLFGSVGINYSF